VLVREGSQNSEARASCKVYQNSIVWLRQQVLNRPGTLTHQGNVRSPGFLLPELGISQARGTRQFLTQIANPTRRLLLEVTQ
jgi:hypothetical protein